MLRRTNKPLALLLVVASLASPGCATILGYGTDQSVMVTTTPDGARLVVDGIATSKTSPGTVELDPSEEHYVRAELGAAKGQSAVRKHLRIWSILINGILTGGLGVLVDYLTGAMYSFDAKLHLNIGVSPPPATTPPATAQGGGQQQPPPQNPGGQPKPPPLAPCTTCGEPRGNKTPCPHCGMD